MDEETTEEKPEEKSEGFWNRFKLKKDQPDERSGEDPQQQTTDDDPAGQQEDTEHPSKLTQWFRRKEALPGLEPLADKPPEERSPLDRTLERLSEYLETQRSVSGEIARAVTALPTLGEQQTRQLEQIRTQIDRLSQATETLTAALEALPKSTREQSEKLSLIEDQLQTEGQTDRAVLDSLDNIGRHVAAMVRLTENQYQLLEAAEAKAKERFDLLTRQLKETSQQSKIGKLILVLLIVLVLLLAYSISAPLLFTS